MRNNNSPNFNLGEQWAILHTKSTSRTITFQPLTRISQKYTNQFSLTSFHGKFTPSSLFVGGKMLENSKY
jgi:hypothetical protein